ncbi:hypothetical protein GCM10009657_34270 [Oryzihumus leptocrescens]
MRSSSCSRGNRAVGVGPASQGFETGNATSGFLVVGGGFTRAWEVSPINPNLDSGEASAVSRRADGQGRVKRR